MRFSKALRPLTALLVVFLASSLAHTEPTDESQRRHVVLTTSDKIKIAATYHPGGSKGGAGVVLLPMFRSNRNAWDAALEALHARGISILAIDPRGHGRSAALGAPALQRRVESRDPGLFGGMHADALAAIQWLGAKGRCDPKRIVLVGASVGGSVALDVAARHPRAIAGVLWLSPGIKYLGLDSLAHAKALPATLPVMLLVHDDEAAGARALQKARPSARLVTYETKRPTEAGAERAWAHGTNMLGRLPLVEQTIASFAAAAAGSKTDDVVLDGIVEATGPNADAWARAVEVGLSGEGRSVRAYRVGRRIVFGGVAGPGFRGLAFEVQTGDKEESSGGVTTLGPPQIVGADLTTGRVLWSFGGMGSMPNFPGLPGGPMFGKTRPVFRAVTTDAGTSFEGEWMIPTFLGADSKHIRLSIAILRAPPPGPRGGGVRSYSGNTVNLKSR